jgi:hypothetical protein
MTKKCNLCQPKFTLTELGLQLVSYELFQYQSQILLMFFFYLGVNQNVVDENHKKLDDPMAPNLVASIECQEKCDDSRSVASNLSQYSIQFGTVSFDGKYYKEYDKLGCELI